MADGGDVADSGRLFNAVSATGARGSVGGTSDGVLTAAMGLTEGDAGSALSAFGRTDFFG